MHPCAQRLLATERRAALALPLRNTGHLYLYSVLNACFSATFKVACKEL